MVVKHYFRRFLGSSRMALLGLSLGAISTFNPSHTAIANPIPLSPNSQIERPNRAAESPSWEATTEAIASVAGATGTLHEAQHADPASATIDSALVAQFNADEDLLAQLSSGCAGGLKVETVRGVVTFEGRPIQAGECLQPAIGTIVTDVNSTARLRFDNFRGSLEVEEVSEFDVETLADANIDIFVRSGQVRFSLGRLTPDLATVPSGNPVATKKLLSSADDSILTQDTTGDSPFRVRTPTGVAGVRGTSFGVDVGPDGQTGVRTIDGNVIASGGGQQVTVGPNQFTVIGEGLAPTAPQEIPPESKFRVLVTKVRGSDRVRIQGKIDSPDILLLDGELVETNPDGTFSMMVPLPPSRRLRFVVRGPAVRERVYVLPVQ